MGSFWCHPAVDFDERFSRHILHIPLLGCNSIFIVRNEFGLPIDMELVDQGVIAVLSRCNLEADDRKYEESEGDGELLT